MPALYREATWDRCPHRGVVDPFLDEMPANVKAGRGLIMVGPIGVGKSSTAGLIVREAITRGLSCRWSYVPELLAGLSDKNRREYVIRLEVEPDLLIWDDFNAQKMAEWQVEFMDRITEQRYRSHKAMIVTTNLTLQGLRGYTDAARMVDRWRQRCQAVTFAGESLRETWRDR